MGLSQKSWEMTNMLHTTTGAKIWWWRYEGWGTQQQQVVLRPDRVDAWFGAHSGATGRGRVVCATEHRLLLQHPWVLTVGAICWTGRVSAATSGYDNRASSHCYVFLISRWFRFFKKIQKSRAGWGVHWLPTISWELISNEKWKKGSW